MLNKEAPADLLQQLLAVIPTDKPAATRASSGAVLQKVAELMPALYGGLCMNQFRLSTTKMIFASTLLSGITIPLLSVAAEFLLQLP